ncbi:MAG TPA: hypothetical protein VGD43_24435, partial [Micromonospora sp.]
MTERSEGVNRRNTGRHGTGDRQRDEVPLANTSRPPIPPPTPRPTKPSSRVRMSAAQRREQLIAIGRQIFA